jgi:DNA-binding MarR family transcriptional regulator
MLTEDPPPLPRRSPCDDRGYANAHEVIDLLRRFQHRLEVLMDQCFEAYGVSFGQYRALEVVSDRPSHVSGIARRLRITRQAADRLVRKLERSGLVTTTHLGNFTDVEITELGSQCLARFRRFKAASIERPLEQALSGRELRHLVLLMERADSALGAGPTSRLTGLTGDDLRRMWWLDD